MNFLTFIFSLILIFSLGTFVTLEKQAGDRRLRSTFLGHITANRKLLSKWESETYQTFRSRPNPPSEQLSSSTKKEPKPAKTPPINPECAKINIGPLIQEGREAHPFLYEITLKLLKQFYGASIFDNKPQLADPFLTVFLKKAKEAMEKKTFSLEKLSLEAPIQWQYYKMLKGTKQWDQGQKIGYPSLLDMVKVEEKPSKICLSHAHPGLIALFFGDKAADKLYQQMHGENSSPITKEAIEQACSESHIAILEPAIFDFLELRQPSHAKDKKTTWIAEDQTTKISLRKNIYIQGSL